MRIEKNVMAPMRDGVRLATDIYLSDRAQNASAPASAPTLVARTPYDKENMAASAEIAAYVRAGYAVAVQDVRGRYASEGEFYPYVNEANDGLDFYDWLIKQPWCDGRIGTFGGSYLGGTQTLSARYGHPAVKAMAPEITFDDQFENCIYQGGAKVMHDLVWTVRSIIPEIMRRAGLGAEAADSAPEPEEALREIPLGTHPCIKKWGAFYGDWRSHSTACEYWDSVSPRTGYDGMAAIPALNISGWYDIFVHSTLNNYAEMRKRNKNTRLIMGPWTHMNYSGRFSELSFGEGASAAALGLTQIKIDWFDRYVKGKNDSGVRDDCGSSAFRGDEASGEPPVKIFVMGINQWRDEADWPLSDTKYRAYCLCEGGKLSPAKARAEADVVVAAVTSADASTTAASAAPGASAYDEFAYDPLNPVPTVGGGVILPGENSSGPKDQSRLDGRADILSYVTGALDSSLEVIGRITVELVASSDCADTDFTAKLSDVYPDGRAMLLADGIIRARFRESFRSPKPMEPNKVYKLDIDLGGTANVFLPGHRVRLDISGGNFPKYDRNSNTGGDISTETVGAYRVAHNRVYHASRLILPVIER